MALAFTGPLAGPWRISLILPACCSVGTLPHAQAAVAGAARHARRVMALMTHPSSWLPAILRPPGHADGSL